METEAENPKKCARECGKCAVACLLLFLVAGIACWYVHHPHRPRPTIMPEPGTLCTVLFRKDVLEKDTTPIGQMKGCYNKYTLTIQGKLIAVSHEAILFEYYTTEEYRRMWIPKSSIAFIEYPELIRAKTE